MQLQPGREARTHTEPDTHARTHTKGQNNGQKTGLRARTRHSGCWHSVGRVRAASYCGHVGSVCVNRRVCQVWSNVLTKFVYHYARPRFSSRLQTHEHMTFCLAGRSSRGERCLNARRLHSHDLSRKYPQPQRATQQRS